jgi:hypothetical protein
MNKKSNNFIESNKCTLGSIKRSFDKKSIRKHTYLILDELGLKLVSFETYKPAMDWTNYEIKYANKAGREFYWYGRTDCYDNDINSIEHKQGMLNDFYNEAKVNCA